jgi:molybdopterin molybdotransferase
MLGLQEALARILAAVPSPAGEEVALGEAAGRVAAEGLAAPLDLPLFDNSSMDGYAVRAADVAAACLEAPASLRLCGRIVAGESPAQEVRPGACARLFTGSPMPPGADAVVMQEDTRVVPTEPGVVLVLESVKAGENVRRRGEDVKRGATVVEAGDRLSAGRISLLAAMGRARVLVGRRPVAGLLAAGSELREPGQPLAPGQIYESNRSALAALVRGAGAVPRVFPLVPDTPDATRSALAEALAQCDAVVSTGGVSVGELDFIKDALAELGGAVEFWRVAIKPGRPFVFGRWRKKLLFGLPGNPVSALVTFLLLARPALLRWQGAGEIALPAQPGLLAEPLANPGPRPHFMRVRVDGAGQVYCAGLQASHALSSLAAANGLVEVPPQTTLPRSSRVTVMRWE